MRVRKAVFPAAGWGTRFLPATKAQPKEMLPLVDKPVIQYAVEEAVAAGIEQVIIVTSSQKRAIEDHFDVSYELEHLLEERGDVEMLRRIRHISDLAQIAYVRQKEQLGLGHAVLVAKELIGHEPFAVILSDDVVVGDRPCIGQLIHAYDQTHASVVAVMEVPLEETGRYGVIDPEPAGDNARPRPAPPGEGRRREARPVGRPLHARDHRTLRPDAEDLRQAGADPARRGWRDPAHRRHRGADGGAGGLRLRIRGHALRRGHHDGLAEGVRRAGAAASRPVGRVPDLPRAGPVAPADRSCAASRHRTAGAAVIRCGTMPAGPARAGAILGQRGEHVAEIGSVLGGRYRLVELLGQGGMATIYRATDGQLGRDVAIKVLRPEYGRDPDFVARFRRRPRPSPR